jgi:hypothetical protein
VLAMGRSFALLFFVRETIELPPIAHLINVSDSAPFRMSNPGQSQGNLSG